MNKKQTALTVNLALCGLVLVASRLYGRKQDRMHAQRMLNLERETQNIRDANEKFDPLLTELDRKIEAGKFWLIVTDPE